MQVDVLDPIRRESRSDCNDAVKYFQALFLKVLSNAFLLDGCTVEHSKHSTNEYGSWLKQSAIEDHHESTNSDGFQLRFRNDVKKHFLAMAIDVYETTSPTSDLTRNFLWTSGDRRYFFEHNALHKY